jgi:beta-glucosidase
VAVVGPNADEAKLGGGGEAMADHPVTMSPLDGIRKRASGRVTFARAPANRLTLILRPRPRTRVAVLGERHRSPSQGPALPAETTDVAVVVVQDYASEGEDREPLALPGAQDRLVRTVATAAERTVVVLQTAGPVEMPWLSEIDAVLEAWYPGQEGGAAIARVLYGDADPGGRLPVTFGAAEGDYPANSRSRYPGVEGWKPIQSLTTTRACSSGTVTSTSGISTRSSRSATG